MLVLPVAIAVGVLALAGSRGVSVLKKQGVAWGLTALMVVAAIGIGYGKAHASNAAEPAPDFQPGSSSALETVPPNPQQGATAPNAAAAGYYERDDTGVLSDDTMAALNARNQRLYERYGVVIGVFVCSYGRSDLPDYAYNTMGQVDLQGNNMLVVLDIKGQDYGMIQGANLVRDFTDEDCSDYTYRYMERDFARGNYDAAVLNLTEMLEAWYGTYFG